MINTVLFDLDGVLVDACDFHYNALNRALKEVTGLQISRSEHISTYNGLPTVKKLNIFQHEMDLFLDESTVCRIKSLKNKYTDEYIDTINTDFEKMRLMQILYNRKCKIGCVSNSIRKTVDTILKNLGIIEFFNVIISNEDCDYTKPDPFPYLIAMKKLSAEKQNTLIVEDSPVGVSAAKHSNAHVLEVRNALDVTTPIILSTIYEINKNSSFDFNSFRKAKDVIDFINCKI